MNVFHRGLFASGMLVGCCTLPKKRSFHNSSGISEAHAGTADAGNEKPAIAALIWSDRSSSIAMLLDVASLGVLFQSAANSALPAEGGGAIMS